MLPLGLLGTLIAAGVAGYQYSKHKHKNKGVATGPADANLERDSVAKNVNTYNYYTNDSENGTTLFGQDKKQRNIFGAKTTI